jgi:hypothetical protein
VADSAPTQSFCRDTLFINIAPWIEYDEGSSSKCSCHTHCMSRIQLLSCCEEKDRILLNSQVCPFLSVASVELSSLTD